MNRISLSTHCDARGNWHATVFKGDTDVARGQGASQDEAVRAAHRIFKLPYQPLG